MVERPEIDVGLGLLSILVLFLRTHISGEMAIFGGALLHVVQA